MNTQNTPVHIRLWHKHFWFLALAYLLMSVAVYAFVPVLPAGLAGIHGLSACGLALSFAAFGGGMLLSGGFCNYLVQRYRRNKVCVVSIAMMVLVLSIHYYIVAERIVVPLWVPVALRLALGAAFGLAQMVLSGVLVIDVCESYNRTEANYCMSWFYRLGLSLGPLVGIMIAMTESFSAVLLFSVVCLFISVILILSVYFPFRAPDDNVRVLGLDRFFLPNGWLLALNLMLFSLAVGMVLSVMRSVEFYSMLATGFLMSLLAQRIVFADAELKSEVICGMLLVGAALLIQITRNLPVVAYIMPVMLGLGIGLVSGRFLLFFVKLSRHCQRGTSQSTYNISWEIGLWSGLAIGYIFADADFRAGADEGETVFNWALILMIIALALYNFVTHKWYLSNKNR